jgi:hypothetical protein
MNSFVMSLLPIRRGLVFFTIAFLLLTLSARAQLSGVKTIPGDYATVTLAVTALNSSGVGSGGVTFDIAANYTEAISSTISVTATGTALNPIVFQKNPSTSGANPLITAYTGGIGTPASAVQDGIWRLVGSDYITILNIDIRDNPLNVANPATMEYGFALYKASSTNGSQNVRIQGCTITLNRVNNASATNPMTEGSAGIIMMNATATNAVVVLGTGSGGGNSNNKFYGNTIQNCNIGISMIGVAPPSPFTDADTNNDVGGSSAPTGNTIINYGGAVSATNTSTAIRTLNQRGINISYNVINNNDGSGVNHPTTLYGILNGTSVSASATISNNTISLKGGGTATNITAIQNDAGSTASNNTINISNNSIVNGSYTTATSGSFFGITNSSSAATVTIANNIFTGNSTAATSGTFSPIRNTGAVSTAINITGNQIGNGSSGAVTFTAANSGAQAFINNSAGASTAALTIANNNFQGITYSVQGTGSNSYILNSAATLSQTITSNTFTSLAINITGNLTFISNSVILSATGTQNINSNSIVGSFTKNAAGGTVTIHTSTAASIAGGVSNALNNNFSNITVTGATVMDGWVNTDAGAGTKTIQNNTFSNWTVGTSLCNGMNVNLSSTSNSVTGNTISNISGSGTVTGITTAAGNDKISGNTIHSLSTSGASVVSGIVITGGTNKQVFANKIYDIQLNGAGTTATGISVTGSTLVTANLYNNLIGDVKAPAGNSTGDVIRGISITTTATNSTINVYYNTIYINATSSGTNFSTSGIFHTASATATTATLNLRNNIISNTSTPNGTGFTVALRRSATALSNYTSTSNNNLFYAGSQSSTRLLYYDGTNQSQTLAAFKTLVAPMESSSVTEDLVASSRFVSTSGASAFFLHLDPARPTLAEGGAVNITGFTSDFDSQTRQGNPGYSGTGTAPDIGADEMAGTKATALAGTYFVGTGQTFTSLTAANGLFSEVNSLGLSGNIIVSVTSDLAEDGTYALLAWAEQGAGNYTITIKPDASVMRTIAGNVVNGLIRLNGTKRVTFDGSNGTTNNYFTFRNTNAVGTIGTAFTFINGASNNTLSYSNVEAYANSTNGVILFSTSTASTGNNSNTVNNCSINATVAGNVGSVGIYSGGTVGKENTSNSILNCTISNYRDRGIELPSTGSTAWTISGNSLYNGTVTGSINYTAGSLLYGIKISGGAGYTVANNFIGGSAALATGTNATYASTAGLLTYHGIHLTTASATPASTIKGNTVAGITVSCVPTSTTGSSVFNGIETFGSGITIGGSLAGEGNTIGSMTNNSSIVTTTTTSASNTTSTVYSINCSSSGGQVIGNRTGGIDMQNLGTVLAATTFRGIYLNGVTAPSITSGNTIGGTNANSIRFLSSSAPASLISGLTIGTAVTSAFAVTANTMQNMSFQSTGGTGTNVYGIANNAGLNSVVTLSNNIITNNSTGATTGGLVGIYSASSSSSVTISGNTVSNNATTSATSFFYGISPNGANTAVVSITGNTISGNTTASNSMAIYNLAAGTTLNITNNTISGNVITSTSAVFFAIYNQGAVTGAININSNSIGTPTTPAITYSAANTAGQLLIQSTAGTATSNLTINNNNFQGIANTLQASGNYFLISNTAATLSQNISGNLFTNLSINTTGNVTLISNNVALSATGTQNINNNSISGTFAKTGAGGTVVGFSNSSAVSPSGSVINHHNNDLSNITVTGATIIVGWLITDTGSSTRNIYNNTFSNWTAGTGTVTGLQLTISGTTNTVTGNTISNITSAGTINGITCAAVENISLNTIHTLASSGDNSVNGINVTGGTTKQIFRNKIYNLSKTISGTTTFSVSGIVVTTVATSSNTYIYNNTVGDLKAPAANYVDAVRGISVLTSALTSNIFIYYNTIYLNAASTGTNFGTSGVYHIGSATSTTAQLDMRNNIIANYSTPNGTGRTVAFRRSAAALQNYGSSSNNNLYYAGTPGTTRLIYFDGTNSDQTITTFKVRVTLRDLSSQTEDVAAKFLSSTGSSALFLHVDASVSTVIESGASNITGYTTDFDGQIRAGNAGYTGTSLAPDLGADEIFGLESVAPVITYTLLANTASTSNIVLSSVTITDASGVNVVAGTKPRVYYKRFSDANAWLDNTPATSGWKFTEATNAASPFSFTIDYSLLFGGATGLAGAIQYFVIAQDNATVPNVAINSGTFALSPATVALTGSAFPIGGTINSYNISLGGTYNVGNAEVFKSLTRADGLFAAINNAGMNSSITVNITSDLSEDGAVALNQWIETGAGGYTLSIHPDAGIPRIISGNVINGLIRFNGADRVNIDGRNSGTGPFLRFVNTNTAGTTGTAFTFINGASNNTIQYSEIEAYANATNGVLLFSTSTAPAGNTNNTIDNCAITATVSANTGNVAIYSAATAGKDNLSIVISNNTITSYRDRAIDVASPGSQWTISGNSIYNGDISSAISYAASSALHGIRIQSGAGYSILNNYIGGSAPLASGTAVYNSSAGSLSFIGLQLTTNSSSPASLVRGNTISGVSVSSVPTAASTKTFAGIETNGQGITIGGSTAGEGNTIGSMSVNSSITVTTSTTSAANTTTITGIDCQSTGGSIIGNQIGGVDVTNIGSAPAPSTIVGINVNSATAPSTVNTNTIGGPVTNSIRVMSSSTALATIIHGITITSVVTTPVTFDVNTVQNIANLSGTSSGIFTGINNGAASTASITISNNIIQNISTASNVSSSSGIYSGIFSQSASIISNNTIDNILAAATGTSSQVRGIWTAGAVAHTISSNMIGNLSAASTRTADVTITSPSEYVVAGILSTATTASQNIFSNTLFSFNATSSSSTNTVVGGIAVSGSAPGNIYRNRINRLTNSATGIATLPGISGITAFSGTFNVYNNVVSLSNSNNSNRLRVHGITHNTTSAWGYYFNTVYISGGASGAARSAAFIRTASASNTLRNNIFLNTRTGTGPNYGISNSVAPPATNWTNTTSDYNDLFGTTAAGEWGTIAQTLAQWKTSSGGDSHSVSSQVTFISSTNDLTPDPLANCTISNAAIPVTSPVSITTDIVNTTRDAVTPDIGAYEFAYAAIVAIAGNNSPVCNGSLVSLTADPGAAINSTFSWTDPNSSIVSTLQNPSLNAIAGTYSVTITDATGCTAVANTNVVTLTRPTAVLSGSSAICSGSTATISLNGTGTGTLIGTLSSGDGFNGAPPSFTFGVTPVSTTTYTIASLSDDNCAALPQDVSGSASITVNTSGQWYGTSSNLWTDAGNWCGGVPLPTTNVVIAAGTPFAPELSGAGYSNNLTTDNGTSLTLIGTASLDLKGDFINNGTFNTGNGTLIFSGTNIQSITSATTTSLYNLTVTNTSVPGLRIQSNHDLRGVLTLGANAVIDADGSGNTSIFTLRSTADNPTQDASIAALPAGAAVVGDVTVQRFMSIEGANNGRIYRYISSPLQNATVADIQNEIPVTGLFTGASTCAGCLTNPSILQYNENVITDANHSGAADLNDGYAGFPLTSNTETFTPGRGYGLFVRANLLSSASWDVRGIINAANVTPIPMPMTFTSSGNILNDGWNLVGNPFPSAIDWNAASGWTKTNVGAVIYMHDNGGGTNQFATWNGVTGTNGGSRYIAMGQSFWVKASGATPSLQVTEAVKTAGTQTTFFRVTPPSNLLRITMRNNNERDETVIHLRDDATGDFDNNADALKMDNSGFNLSTLDDNGNSLAINSTSIAACVRTIKLKVSNAGIGTYSLNFTELESFENYSRLTLLDGFMSDSIDLRSESHYDFAVTADPESTGAGRFEVIISSEVEQNFMLSAGDICPGTDARIQIQNSQAGVTYNSSLGEALGVVGNGNDIVLTIPHKYMQTGTNNIEISAMVPGCDKIVAKSVDVVVNELSPEVTTAGTSLISSYEEGNQWYLNDQPIAGAVGQMIEPQVDGLYYVQVTSGECVASSHPQQFIVTGMDDTLDWNITASPNPVKDRITIFVPAGFGEVVEVKISNLLGQIIATVQMRSAGDNTIGDFSVRELPSGHYIIHIKGMDSKKELRFVKE